MVYHVEDTTGVAAGYGGTVDYAEHAAALEAARAAASGGSADPVDYDPAAARGGADWDPTWRGGDSWRTQPAMPLPTASSRRAAGSSSGRPAVSSAAAAGVTADIWSRPPAARAAGSRSDSLDLVVPDHRTSIVASAKPRPRASAVPPPASVPGRSLHQVYECSVGRFSFRLLHTLEGRWNGEAQVMGVGGGGADTSPRVCLTSLWFDGDRGAWVERQRFTTSDGVSTTQALTLHPVGDGRCRVRVEREEEGDEMHAPPARRRGGHAAGGGADTGSSMDSDWRSGDVELTLQEVGGNMLLLTGVHRRTGRPVLVETTTVVDSLRRARTVQRFDADGALQSVFAFRESRVIDAVTGALDARHA